jgi:hypothetical protein
MIKIKHISPEKIMLKLIQKIILILKGTKIKLLKIDEDCPTTSKTPIKIIVSIKIVKH